MTTSDHGFHQISIVDVFLELQPILLKIVTSYTKSNLVAQDLTQEIYFKVISLAKSFPNHDDARHYLVRIAINSSIDHLRTDERRRKLLMGSFEIFEHYSPSEKSLEDVLIVEETLKTIDHVLTDLPEKYKQALYLSRVEGLTHVQIAKTMGVSKSSVEKYIIKALAHCQKLIDFED